MSRTIRPRRWSSATASSSCARGAIAQIGTPREIYFAPKSRFVAEFIGAANIIEAPVENGHLVLPGGRQPIGGDANLAAAVAMIRPETIAIVDAGRRRSRASSTASVSSATGSASSSAAHRDKLLTVDAPNTIKAKAGERVGLVIAAEAVRLLPPET